MGPFLTPRLTKITQPNTISGSMTIRLQTALMIQPSKYDPVSWWNIQNPNAGSHTPNKLYVVWQDQRNHNPSSPPIYDIFTSKV